MKLHGCCVVAALAAVVWCGSTRALADGAASGPAAVSPAEQAERDALRALIPQYEQAVNSGRLDGLKPLLDDQFTGVMVTGDEVSGFSSLDAYWAQVKRYLGAGGSYRVKVNLIDHAVISGDMAVAHGTTDETVKAKGKEFRFEGRWTAVCRKRDGQWRLLRIQASMDPIENSFVAAAAQRRSIIVGVIAWVAGLAVGWVLCALAARRKPKPAAEPKA